MPSTANDPTPASTSDVGVDTSGVEFPLVRSFPPPFFFFFFEEDEDDMGGGRVRYSTPVSVILIEVKFSKQQGL